MKKNGQQLEKEQLFSAETAVEVFPEERPKLSSTPHKDRLKVKDKNFSKHLLQLVRCSSISVDSSSVVLFSKYSGNNIDISLHVRFSIFTPCH